ncbi:Peptidyl-prolyl cis-trans isomerase H [Savitreella phatthalungensis]
MTHQRPIVFLDISIGGVPQGRLKIQLYSDIAPKTAENFRQFCTGEHRTASGPIGYKGCRFHRIIRGFCCQGGDFVKGDGTGSTSVYGRTTFPDENFIVKHDKPFLLSMANSGKDSNGCQFFVTTAPAAFLDGKHVVFGELIEGQGVVQVMERVRTDDNDKPAMAIEMIECGEM